jgi:hypothetical protein
MKRWDSFSAMNASQNEAKLTYIKLNRETPSASAKATARQVPTA